MTIKQAQYREGREATESFEKGMKALFQVPKAAVLPKKTKKQGITLRKTKRSDKDFKVTAVGQVDGYGSGDARQILRSA